MEYKSSCAVIGEGNLLLGCLKKLKKEGFKILHAFTNTAIVNEFCKDENIPCHTSNCDMMEILGGNKIGFLFSIANPIQLPKTVLELPLHYSIQYHDSPLPKYAGIHATSWALINGETKHGICWNILDTGMDSGDILQEKQIDIEMEDTAFTLNVKCQEAAYEAFSDLLRDIQMETINRKCQSSYTGSFYGPGDIPPNLGVLDFHWSSGFLGRLIRSLDFGKHENGLCSPKCRSESGNHILVTKVLSEKSETHSSEKLLPGTIVKVQKNIVDVRTREGEIRLAIANIDGTSLSQEEMSINNLREGRPLSTHINIDISLLREVKRKESFWVKQLMEYEPLLFPRQRMSALTKDVRECLKNTERRKCTIHLPYNIDLGEESFMAAVVCFLCRICASPKISIGFVADKTFLRRDIQNLFADICPLNVDLEISNGIQVAIEKCKNKMDICKRSDTYLLDVFYRYPGLKERKQKPFHNIVLGKEPMEAKYSVEKLLAQSKVLILIKTDSKTVNIHYNSRVGQDLSYVHTIMSHFPTFIQSIVDSERTPLARISLLSYDEFDRLYQRREVNKTVKTSLFDEISQKAKKLKWRTALKTSFHSLSYATLMDDVSNFSHLLCNAVNHDKKNVIGIHLPNSMQYVISVLSVMKLGHVFLPLPVDYPKERIAFTIDEANVSCIITIKEDVESLPCVSDNWEKANTIMIANAKIVVFKRKSAFFNKDTQIHEQELELSGDTTYIMYTSGSTGRPKGVAIREAGVRNVAFAQAALWSMNEDDVVGQFASIGFDATISEIFTSLVSGATLAIFSDKERMGNEFINAVKKMEINTLTLTPSLLNIYDPMNMPSLRKVITAGEACTVAIALKWTSHTKIRFFNAYGPTETTVCATNYEFIATDFKDDTNLDLPVGKAIQGVNVYLLDEFQQPVPSDVVGEIYVGGIGVSDGYIGHASVFNGKRFIQNPMCPQPMILYKTGDHGITDEEGNITYLGRIDDLVNIRGQRVDLTEIETILNQHPVVEMAAVVLHKCCHTNEIYIAAFVAPSSIDVTVLKNYLVKVLPRFMVPTYIVKQELNYFSLTTNGKIDRKILEKDETVHNVFPEFRDLKRNLDGLELEIAELWCKILKLEKNVIKTFQMETSFSELGGNSLQLVLLQRSFAEDLGTDLSFTEIGTADTIEDFADVVRNKRKSQGLETKDENVIRTRILEDSSICEEEIRQLLKQVHEQISEPSYNTCPENILISGVTGFLGAYLLSEILLQTTAHVFCMVRSTREDNGMERIRQNLAKYKLWSPGYCRRITIVLSDLAKPKLGIEPPVYSDLINKIDIVFMNAAKMDFNKGYEEHRLENVKGTQHLLLFAFQGRPKHIISTSTLGVFLFPTGDYPTPVMYCETDVIDDPVQVAGGYGQSKWASERMIRSALKYLPGGAIFRPGRITGSTLDGISPENDFFSSILTGMKKLGYFPDITFPFDLTPVDFVAKAMVEISIKSFVAPKRTKQIFHLYNKDTINFCDLFKGMDLQSCPLDEWRGHLKEVKNENQELLHFMPFFLSSSMERLSKWPSFDTSNTDEIVSDSTKELLRPSEDLLKLYKNVLRI